TGTGTGTLPPRPPGAWNATWTDRLKRNLLLNYDKFARPAQHTNTTVVNIGMTFRHVALDELKSIMTVQGWVKMSWIDEKLKWNESEYGDLGILHLANHEIWQPDIVLYNSATGNLVEYYGNTHCLAYPNGEVLWVPPSQFQVFCDLDMRLWPFDTQYCHLTLGSWTYDGDHIDILLDKYGADVQLMETSSEWEFMGVEETRNVKTYSCCVEPYIDITFKLTLRRRSPTYSAIVITPATVIVLLTLATFWLPPTAGEKILLNGCIAVIICIFLMYFSQKLPAMAGHTPLVGSLHNVLLHVKQLYALPIIIPRKLLQASALHHNMMSGNAEELREQQTAVFDDHDHMGNSSDDRQMITPRSRTSSQQDWVLLAAAIDRITFLVYCLLFAILAIVYAV
ncbi:hypothetical protein ANN_06166, partial [Periplaneta americana]